MPKYNTIDTNIATISGLTNWWDASDGSTVFTDTAGTIPATNGTAVARWNDKIAGLNFTQSTSSNRPNFATNIQNGRSVIQMIYDGTTFANNDFMECAGSPAFTAVTEETVFLVVKIGRYQDLTTVIGATTTAEGATIWGSTVVTGVGNYALYASTESTRTMIQLTTANSTDGDGGIRLVDFNNNRFMILAFRRLATTTGRFGISQLWENNSIAAQRLHRSGSCNYTPRIGRGRNNNGAGANEYAEILRFNRYLTDAEMSQVFSILNNKWDVYRNVSWLNGDWFNNPYNRRRIYADNANETSHSSYSYEDFFSSDGDSTNNGWALKSELSAPLNTTITGCLIYNNTTGVYDTIDGTDPSSANQGQTANKFGLEIPLSYAMQQTSGRNVRYVKLGVDGTRQSFNDNSGDWWIDTNLNPYWTGAATGSNANLFMLRFQNAHNRIYRTGGILTNVQGATSFLGTNDSGDAYTVMQDGTYNDARRRFLLWRYYLMNIKAPAIIANPQSVSLAYNPNIVTCRTLHTQIASDLAEVEIVEDGWNPATSGVHTVDGTHPNLSGYTRVKDGVLPIIYITTSATATRSGTVPASSTLALASITNNAAYPSRPVKVSTNIALPAGITIQSAICSTAGSVVITLVNANGTDTAFSSTDFTVSVVE